MDATTNRLTPATGSMNYDAAGNLTNDTYTGQGQRTYDAENRMKQAWATNQWQTYSYDGDGRRVKRVVNGIETWQVYGIGGELLAEYAAGGAPTAPQKEYGYRNGQLLITAEAGSGGGGAQNVSWTNAVGVSVSGNSLTMTAASGWGNAGAASTQSIAAGDGYVETTANQLYTYRMFGLSNGNTNQTYEDIDFALYLAWDNLYIYESGAYRAYVGTYALGDVLRVSVEGGVVKYRKNGTLLYTSTGAPTYPLLVDTALHTNGATLSNVVISGAGGGGGTGAEIKWLVTDQLGTPRIVLNQTGSLAATSRHDYLPFGEELFAGVGGRTIAQGYSQSDNIRQKFAGTERDNESGLDFMQARYYSSTQGRFTSPDQPFRDQEEGDPQSWNLYSYVRNNPLKFTDPTGEARWKEIDGVQHWVGDEDGEYDADLKASWVADENSAIGGYWDFAGDQSAVEIQEPENTIAVRIGPDKAIEVPIFEPGAGGGLRNVTRKAGPPLARGLSNLFRRAWRGIFGGAAGAKTLDELFKAGRLAKASEIAEWAKSQGWTARQTPNGPLKFIDEKGVVRVTIKKGSPRTPGSDSPHVELRDASGQRVDPSGNPVVRKSPGNHTPIQWDW